MSVRRPCRLSQVASSVLIFTPGAWPAPRSINCTTTVRSGVLFLGALGGGGWGTSASSPLGVTGEITMKMISSTSSTSMSGVTLMFALWPPLGPTAIPMIVLLYSPLLPWRRRGRRGGSSFLLLAQQAEVVDPSGTNGIYHLHHAAKTGSHVRLHVHALVLLIGEAIFYLAGEVVDSHLFA